MSTPGWYPLYLILAIFNCGSGTQRGIAALETASHQPIPEFFGALSSRGVRLAILTAAR